MVARGSATSLPPDRGHAERGVYPESRRTVLLHQFVTAICFALSGDALALPLRDRDRMGRHATPTERTRASSCLHLEFSERFQSPCGSSPASLLRRDRKSV